MSKLIISPIASFSYYHHYQFNWYRSDLDNKNAARKEYKLIKNKTKSIALIYLFGTILIYLILHLMNSLVLEYLSRDDIE